MIYRVQKGDTLKKIAVAHNTTLADLLILNPDIENPNLIHPGQEILVQEETLTVEFLKTIFALKDHTHQDKYIYLDGNGFINTPDKPQFTPLETFDARVDVAADDWTPDSPLMVLIAHWNIFGGERSWMLNLQPSGRFNMELGTANGNAWFENWANLPISIENQERRQFRCTYDGNVGGARVCKFYERTSLESLINDDGWVEIGTNGGDTHSGTFAPLHDSSDALTLGANNDGTGNKFVGKIFQAALFVDGILVANPDFRKGELTDSLNNEWTLQGSAG